jgi:hypothetical protein
MPRSPRGTALIQVGPARPGTVRMGTFPLDARGHIYALLRTREVALRTLQLAPVNREVL